jgi:hypothetical protein
VIGVAAEANVAAGNADVLEVRVVKSTDVSLIPGTRVPGLQIRWIEIPGCSRETANRRNTTVLELTPISARGGRKGLVMNSCTTPK